MNLRLVSNYKNNEALRTSFFALAQNTFELDFESWYNQGNWGASYSPYSLALGNTIVANVSVNHMQFKTTEGAFSAMQLGTVMVDEAYRGQGLARRLMEHVLANFAEHECFMYLFANSSVLNFYTRFGFTRADETLHSCPFKLSGSAKNAPAFRPLNMHIPEDLALFNQLTATTNGTSRLSMIENPGLVHFYCSGPLSKNIYFFPSLNAIVVATQENGTLTLAEVFCQHSLPLAQIINALAPNGCTQVQLGFTPLPALATGFSTSILSDNDDALFIRGGRLPKDTRFPLLSHA